MRNVDDVDLKGKRVLMRIDADVPVDDNGSVLDDYRLVCALPTLKHVLKHCKQLVLIGHRGRPKGKNDPKLTMDPVALRLTNLLGKTVRKLDDCLYDRLPEDKILLLENLRFRKGEEEASKAFGKKLAAYADLYLFESFATMQNKHASNVVLPSLLPTVAGYQVVKELESFDFGSFEQPLVAILGGSKLSSKMPIINALVKKVDFLLLGGAMIFTFYRAQGYEVGKSLFEPDYVLNAKFLLNNAKIKIPDDVVIAKAPQAGVEAKTVFKQEIPLDMMGLDIGMASIDDFKQFLEKAKTVFWNGPLGYYELPEFSKATDALARILAKSPARTIVGGGDTHEAIARLGLLKKFSHVSTGGGASLKLIAGEVLPTQKALDESEIQFFV